MRARRKASVTRNMKTTPKTSPPRSGHSKASLLLRWAWLVPLVAVPFSMRDYYFVLQLLSAEVLFTTLLVVMAVLAVVVSLILAAVGYASFRGVATLRSMGH